jgi:dihydrodipicolinate synthase/N-acetylneuraminate lyase
MIGLVGGDPRPPLLPLDDSKTEDLKRLLAPFGL